MAAKTATQQMRLTTFCAEYDIPKNSALLWVHSKGFPAFKLGRQWYVDIPEYYKWREAQHKKDYRYA